MGKSKVPVCESHLSELYDALKKGDMQLVDTIEHELTEAEQCVACAYIFKTHGTVRAAFESYLNHKGFAVGTAEKESKHKKLKFWGLRIGCLFVIFILELSILGFLKYVVFQRIPFTLAGFNFFELTLISLTSVGVFLYIDDKVFE
jgi:hypothetical protein